MNGCCGKWCVAGLSLVAGAVIGVAAVSAAGSGDPKDKGQPAGGGGQGEHGKPDPMMEAWIKAATPGKMHEALKPFEGTFDVEMSFWMDPAQPPQKSKGSMVNTWVLDGRFLRQEYASTFMDMPFKGLGYWGYDNVDKKYIGSWMDTTATGVMNMTGTFDANTMTWTMICETKDPMGKPMRMREVIRLKSKDEHVMEMYSTHDGKEHKSMELVYTRKK